MEQDKHTRVAISEGYVMGLAGQFVFDEGLDAIGDDVAYAYLKGYVKGVEAVVNPLGLEVIIVD